MALAQASQSRIAVNKPRLQLSNEVGRGPQQPVANRHQRRCFQLRQPAHGRRAPPDGLGTHPALLLEGAERHRRVQALAKGGGQRKSVFQSLPDTLAEVGRGSVGGVAEKQDAAEGEARQRGQVGDVVPEQGCGRGGG